MRRPPRVKVLFLVVSAPRSIADQREAQAPPRFFLTRFLGGADVTVDALDNVYVTGSHLVRRLIGANVSVLAGGGGKHPRPRAR